MLLCRIVHFKVVSSTVFWITQERNQLKICGFHPRNEETSGRRFVRFIYDESIFKSIISAKYCKKCNKTACRFNEILVWTSDFDRATSDL
jgi:hypothetical protein